MSGALARVVRHAGRYRAPSADETCDVCADRLPSGHRHLLDIDHQSIRCVCQACALLFDRDAAGNGRQRLVPRRRLRLPEVDTAALGVPVGLACFVPGADAAVDAHYPSPAGMTRCELDPEAWRRIVAECPPLAGLRPHVEALLVNRTRGRRDHWVVPIDDCFALVSVIRREWRGLSGGGRVWPEINRFFDELTERR